MKNLFNFKSLQTLSLGLAATIILVSSCSENKAVDSNDVTNQENLSTLDADKTILVIENDNGSKFITEAAEIQLELISLGKLAQQKGTSDHVKELGKKMEVDHTQTLSEIREMAQAKSVTIPGSESEDSTDAYEKLNEKTGNEFGKSFSELAVEHHEDAIELFEEASRDSEDQQIKAWATNKLSELKNHLQLAEACKEKCDKM